MENKTRILFTASRVSHFKQFHTPYLKYYYDKGYEVHTAAQGTAVFDFPLIQHELVFDKKRPLKNLKGIFLLRKLVKENRIDIVISNATLAGAVTRAGILFLRKRPVVIHSCHGYLFSKNTKLLKKLLLVSVEKFFSYITDLAITMNSEDYEAAKKYKFSKNIVNIPGIGIQPFQIPAASGQGIRREFNIPKDAVLLTYAAEFSNRKNQQSLIRLLEPVLAQNEKVFVLLAGTGACYENCEQLVKEKKLENRILLPGYVSNMQQVLAETDIVLSSSKSEGLPFNIMEAMCCGIPILASRIKGHEDLIIDGQSGFLFSPDDEEEFKSKLHKLINDKTLYEKFSEESKKRSNLFTLDNVFNSVTNAYAIADKRLL
ncbi:MAG: glycosyltransferase [Spirochaetaceae bacterium]|nr:glycosyltransferase [Spirochaetaceae bacterium]